MQPNDYVVTRTPLRVSFAGGGTDLPAYYLEEGGAVFSTSIDQYIYVTLKKLGSFFGKTYRLNYSESENVSSVDEIRNGIARECLKLVPVDPPLYIATIADIPANSGLGASSSFAVGLLSALMTMRGERISAVNLAEMAAQIEIERLHRPVGKQDHFAAAVGGLNYMKFDPNDRVSVEPQPMDPDLTRALFGSILMFWTGISRDAGVVLNEQNSRTGVNLDNLRYLKHQALELRDLVLNGFDLETFGGILDQGWERKRSLAGTITSEEIDHWYGAARAAGAFGGKLCGAGGGGFLLFVAPPERHDAIRRALSQLKELPVRYEPNGTKLILPATG